QRQGPAGGGATSGTIPARHSAAHLDGAFAGRSRARRAFCGPDDFRGLSAVSELDLRIRVIPAIRDIAAAQWDACANPGASRAGALRAGTSAAPGNRFSRLANCPQLESISQHGADAAPTADRGEHSLPDTAAAPAPIPTHASANAE